MTKLRIFKSTRQRPKGAARWWREKSFAYWIMLVFLTAGTLAISYLSAKNAIGNISRRQNPSLALSIVPSEPVALTFIADQQFIASQTPSSLGKVDRMARRALLRQPLNASAVRLMGYVADARGERDRARKLITTAAGLSRREFGAQLWLIEDAVARKDTFGALQHYDIALRSTESSGSILIPTLTGALGDPAVRKGLASYVRQRAAWVPAFLADAIANSNNPADVADILLRAGKLPSNEEYRNISDSLLAKLAEKNMFSTFQQLYRSLPQSRPTTLDSIGMNKDTVSLSYPVAGWSIIDHPAAGGRFSEAADNSVISARLFAGSGERQLLMRKYTFYKPGSYRFKASYNVIQTTSNGQIQWNFQCLSANENTPIWQSIAPLNKSSGSTKEAFTIPANCNNQQLSISVAGGAEQTGVELVLQAMSIMPI